MDTLLASCCLTAFIGAAAAVAQPVEGDWAGTLRPGPGELRLLVHIKASENGRLSATMDSIDQGARGIPVDRISYTEGKLVFDIDRVQGRYEGTHDKDKKLIRGTWTQRGNSLPLDLEPYVEPKERSGEAAKPSDIDGDWTGTLDAGAQTLRVVLHVVNGPENKLNVSMDVPDQGARGIPAQIVTRDGKKLSFEMRGVGAKYSGTLNGDLTRLEGTWTQGGNDLPLSFQRDKK